MCVAVCAREIGSCTCMMMQMCAMFSARALALHTFSIVSHEDEHETNQYNDDSGKHAKKNEFVDVIN